jgi:hypothetical protein
LDRRFRRIASARGIELRPNIAPQELVSLIRTILGRSAAKNPLDRLEKLQKIANGKDSTDYPALAAM